MEKSSFVVGVVVALVFLPLFPYVDAVELLPIWDKESYQIGEWAQVTIDDYSKNYLPGEKDELIIIIQSDSNTDGMSLSLIETEKNSGIFSGFVRLSTNISSEGSLYVQEKDSIYAIHKGYVKSVQVESKNGLLLSPILVSTDKTTYKFGEVIEISGSVSGGNPAFPIHLSIMAPDGNIILTDTIDLSYVLSFDTQINTQNLSWDSGNYKIVAWHQSESLQAEAIFSYSTSYDLEKRTKSIKILHSPLYIEYSMSAGKLTLVRPNTNTHSLTFSIDSNSGGHLTVELPRPLIDVQSPSGYDDFVVLVDGRNSEYVENINPNERTLTIPFTHKVRTLEVQGTFLDLNPESNQSIESVEIPEWIRNNAEWWSKGLIGEGDFLSGMQYLINQGIMKVPLSAAGTEPVLPFIPHWIKDTAGWWASGKVTDQDFLYGIQYLIEHGVITV